MNCRVVVEAAVPVYDVASADEAVRIAISKTGEMLNPDLNYVEINMGQRSCPHCGEGLEPAFIAADESLVALELEMTVFNVERDEHAARIARKEIGQRLENIPLEVLEIEELPEEGAEEETAVEAADEEEETEVAAADEEEETEVAATDEEAGTAGESTERETDDSGPDASAESGAGPGGETDEEILPEFEDLIDEEQ